MFLIIRLLPLVKREVPKRKKRIYKPKYDKSFQTSLIAITRGRSYKKNDNCFVEQKNNSVVRHLVGYYRYEGQEALETLEKLYKLWCLLVNYFYPSMKILEKMSKDARVYKKYDTAKTPYKRCLDSDKLSEEEKQKLIKIKKGLNIIELKKLLKKH